MVGAGVVAARVVGTQVQGKQSMQGIIEWVGWWGGNYRLTCTSACALCRYRLRCQGRAPVCDREDVAQDL
jgi:hypothetical protein